MGLLGTRDRAGTAYLGLDLEGTYRLTPRWTSGLRGTLTNSLAARRATSSDYPTVERPRFDVYGATWTHTLLLLDGPRWRLAPLVGVGMGWVTLRDRDQQVSRRGTRDCDCTEAKPLATAHAPLTEVGLALTYKLRPADAPWLTLRGQWRQWHGPAPFGGASQGTQYLLSLGISLPDAFARNRPAAAD